MKDNKQTSVVMCALADLCGSLQAYQQGNVSGHDWKAHMQTIHELAQAFGLASEVPEDCK
jgi:hypothetical protein